MACTISRKERHMTHATGTIVGLLALAILSAGALGQSPTTAPPSPALLLEKGIYTEETLGDLDAAIVIYRQVVEQNRAWRATDTSSPIVNHRPEVVRERPDCLRVSANPARFRLTFRGG